MRSRLLWTIDDFKDERMREIELEYDDACDCPANQEAAKGSVLAEFSVGSGWRGWIVTCEYCGEKIGETEP